MEIREPENRPESEVCGIRSEERILDIWPAGSQVNTMWLSFLEF